MKFSTIFAAILTIAAGTEVPTRTFKLSVPNAKPTLPDTYVCTSVKLDKTNTYYLTGFLPLADMKTAHHMLLYGCKTPGQEDPLFNCGAMTARQEGLSGSMRPCGSGAQVVYAWAMNAPQLNLPDDVGFKVGGPDSEIDWLVLQVHYASTTHIPEEGDNSGVVIKYTNVPMPKSAGVWYTMTNGRMPAQTETYAEAACKISTNKELHPFAFRVHTHKLGTVVSGWKVSPAMEWTLLGRKDPQLPQMFYPTADNTTVIRNGDTIATRCTMYNYQDEAVYMGNTREHEMCNFYLMYWVEGDDNSLSSKSCVTLGPPIYSWGGWILGGGLTNIPDEEASRVDDEI